MPAGWAAVGAVIEWVEASQGPDAEGARCLMAPRPSDGRRAQRRAWPVGLELVDHVHPSEELIAVAAADVAVVVVVVEVDVVGRPFVEDLVAG